MQGSSYIVLFFFSCIAFTIILFLFTRARIQYFNDIDKRILGTKDPFWSNIHGLTIFILLGILIIDFFYVAWDSMAVMCLGSNNCGPSNFESLILLGNRIDTEYAYFYLGSVLMPLIWTSWAFLQELKISKKMRSARTDLLLGNIDGVPTREPMPPVVVQVQEPEQLATVIEAEAIPKNEEGNPATVEQVLAAMDVELKRAIRAAEMLQVELDETKEKVELLEEEVQIRDEEIQQIKDSKSNLDKLITENNSNDDSGKSLSLTDSVMVGDSVMGGVKIDKQINNDPEAIARAVINAYKMGASDSE